MKLVELIMRSDSSRSARRADRDSRMATERHRHAEKKSSKLMRAVEMDKELADIRAEIERLESLMRQNEELVEVCEPETGKDLDDDDDDWDELGSTDDLKHCRLGKKEEILVSQEGNRLRSVEGLKDCREDSQGISNCQLGKETEMRSAEDLMDCQEDNEETLHCQLGNERRSDEDLEDCQEGSGNIEDCQEGRGSVLNCQVGRDEQLRPSVGLNNSEMSWNQPGELAKQEGSKVNMDQQVQLTEVKEHQDDILMIGGIQLFLPSAQEEAKISVINAATTEEQSQLEMTVGKEKKLVQMVQTAQAEMKKGNEHSVECLNTFSQEAESVVALELTAEEEAEAEGESEHSEEWLSIFSREDEKTATWEVAEEEKEVVALKLAAKEAKEQADRIITPWEMELEMLEDWLNNPEPTRELTEFELSGKRMTEQQDSQEETAELKTAAEWQLKATDEDEEDSMGDHSNLPMGQKFLQLRRLQELDQPREQLDEVIEDIRRLMLRSVQTTSEEQLGREKAAAAAQLKHQQNGADGKLQRLVWDPGGFQQLQGKLMRRSS
jgi:hypothetical protein